MVTGRLLGRKCIIRVLGFGVVVKPRTIMGRKVVKSAPPRIPPHSPIKGTQLVYGFFKLFKAVFLDIKLFGEIFKVGESKFS